MLKFIINTLCITFLASSLSFCKKEKKATSQIEETSAPSPAPFKPAQLNGYFVKYLDYHFYNDTFTLNRVMVDVGIYNKMIHKDSTQYHPGTVDVGNVLLNDSIIKKAVGGGLTYYSYYNQENVGTFHLPFKWRITGNNDFPAVDFIESGPLAAFKGANKITDTLFLFKENTLKVTRYANADKVEVVIDASPYIQCCCAVTKTLNIGDTTLLLKPNDFYMMSSCFPHHVNIKIIMHNDNFQLIHGKSFNFQTISTFIVPMIPVRY